MKSCLLYLTSQSWFALARGSQDAHASGALIPESAQTLAPVAQWLQSQAAGKTRVDVLISAATAGFLTLPWLSTANTGAAIRKRVLHAWEKNGLDGTAHDIRIQWPRYGEPIVAVAYPSAWLRSVEDLLATAGATIGTVTCSAVAIAERYAARMPRGTSLLVIEEEDAVVGLHLQDGTLTDVEVLSPQGEGLDEVPVWLHRKQMDFPDAGQVRWFLPSQFHRSEHATALLALPDSPHPYGVALLGAVA
ncbi:hypothetical protein [Pseudoxanthomonas wuyuanensis]|uniref:Uncharacterized protein n=1 Tax=Pseudoxanthomonas wuyuanensis TaxID=1073196 RepID=A0A286CYZ3_9GAMM|nr:hypothetical protein [Pseudoxanthomonas wuyuanensis]KAF1722236.1 hypothetical protein CSC75_03075 [Pseudoxanthomonas wuyuanensis]SOD51618.1 hypothetical protein SAMN06296416_101744 [Pseudoxanthomonas wuyuanensis]